MHLAGIIIDTKADKIFFQIGQPSVFHGRLLEAAHEFKYVAYAYNLPW